jgi:hypothetical protein
VRDLFVVDDGRVVCGHESWKFREVRSHFFVMLRQ